MKKNTEKEQLLQKVIMSAKLLGRGFVCASVCVPVPLDEF